MCGSLIVYVGCQVMKGQWEVTWVEWNSFGMNVVTKVTAKQLIQPIRHFVGLCDRVFECVANTVNQH